MRVLSIGHRMRHRNLDNHTILNAPNIADYDAIVLDLGATFDTVREAAQQSAHYSTNADVPIVNGDSTDGMTGLAEVLQRRRDEIARALDNGATILVFTAPQSRFHGINGLHSFDRFFLLPAPDGVAWDDRTVQGSEGTAVAVVDHDHPFVRVFEVYRRNVQYRAVFNDRAEGVAKAGRVLIRATGGQAVGIDFPVLNGHLVFLPSPKASSAGNFPDQLGAAVMEAMQDQLGRPDEDPPRWANEFAPPGIEDRRNEVQRARADLDQAQAALDEAQKGLREEEYLRDALWAAGDAALLPAALKCGEIIGFRIARDGNSDPMFMDGSTAVHVVVAGAVDTVDMAAHYRLRARLDKIIETRAVNPRGVLIVNGQRQTHPLERKRQFEDAVRVAAEGQGYAILTASDLFRVAYAARAGLPEDRLAQARERIASTNGVVELDDLLTVENEA
ncbi:MAG: hypothetical protein KC458_00620 [Dehalococcoidia bacterium]|nr:hypothetical protein [Dehalococcoidia bacterium]MCB9490549.1 hypothetical protein [Dehalococcoidia bacterium]